jgi:RimJ/RimL family protein N-acetyltransferase
MARANQLAGWLARLTTPEAATRLWSITANDHDVCIGQIGLIPIDDADAHWVSYWLSPDWQGRGIACSALAALSDAALARPGYTRLIAMIAPDNLASIAVIRRAGFAKASVLDIRIGGSVVRDAFERSGGSHR